MPGVKYSKALDGLRGVAILFVLFGHLFKFGIFSRVAQLGWIGVDLFFVLSGFLITTSLLKTRAQPHYLRNFFARRILRIFPVYYGVLIVFYGLIYLTAPGKSYVGDQQYFWTYTSNFYFAHIGYFGDHALAHFWSLAIEEQFYLIWPFLILYFSTRGVLILSGMLLVLGIILRFSSAGEVFAYTFTLCRLDGLLIGAAIAIFKQQGYSFNRKVIPLFLLLLGIVTFFFSMQDDLSATAPMLQQYGYTLLALLFGSLLVLALENRNAQALLSNRTLIFFGKYSYGIYIFHYILFKLFQRYLQLNSVELCVLTFISSVGLAVLSFHFYEKYFLKLKERFIEGKAEASR